MDYIYIGKFLGTHGLKGEIKLTSNFMYIEKILKKDFPFYIGNLKEKELFSSYRVHKNNYLITFKDIDSIEKIKKYVNEKVYVSKDDLNLKKDEFVYEDYIDSSCYYKDKYLGKIKDIVDAGNNNYLFLIDNKEELLIPFNDNFIEKHNDKVIYFKNVEGLIDEN